MNVAVPSVQHRKFQVRLEASSDAVLAVAAYYHKVKRYRVEIAPVWIAPTADVAEDYFDEGDLSLLMPTRDPCVFVRHRIEVKHLIGTDDFTCARDFEHPVVFISNKEAAERADGKVSAYFIVSKNLKHAGVIIPAETKDDWELVSYFAKNTGNYEKAYACPKDKVKFRKL